MMSIEKNKTVEIIKDFGANDSDSGSADVQVAILTERIKNQLDKIEGVELLKICSRYRFLVGVGRMFDFKDVRRKIESKICDNHKGD